MDGLIKTGRCFFAAAMVFFGIQHFLYASSMPGPKPGPPWIPGRPLWAWLMGAALIVASVTIATRKQARLTAACLGILLFLYALILYGPRMAAHLHDPGPW